MKTSLDKLATRKTLTLKLEDVKYEECDIVRNPDGSIDAFASRVNALNRLQLLLQGEQFTNLM